MCWQEHREEALARPISDYDPEEEFVEQSEEAEEGDEEVVGAKEAAQPYEEAEMQVLGCVNVRETVVYWARRANSTMHRQAMLEQGCLELPSAFQALHALLTDAPCV